MPPLTMMFKKKYTGICRSQKRKKKKLIPRLMISLKSQKCTSLRSKSLKSDLPPLMLTQKVKKIQF